MIKPTAWSPSSKATYELCPRQYKHGRIDKLPEAKHPAAERGIWIHKKGEEFLKGAIKKVPVEYKHFSHELTQLRKLKAAPEASWGVTSKWEPVDFFAKNVWGRGKMDASVIVDDTLHIVDFKSGKVKDYKDQVEIYAAFALSFFPNVAHIRAELWYLDHEHLQPFEFPVKDVVKAQKKLSVSCAKILADDKFLPTPSRLACQYCKFRTDVKMPNGRMGPCDSWKKV